MKITEFEEKISQIINKANELGLITSAGYVTIPTSYPQTATSQLALKVSAYVKLEISFEAPLELTE